MNPVISITLLDLSRFERSNVNADKTNCWRTCPAAWGHALLARELCGTWRPALEQDDPLPFSVSVLGFSCYREREDGVDHHVSRLPRVSPLDLRLQICPEIPPQVLPPPRPSLSFTVCEHQQLFTSPIFSLLLCSLIFLPIPSLIISIFR